MCNRGCDSAGSAPGNLCRSCVPIAWRHPQAPQPTIPQQHHLAPLLRGAAAPLQQPRLRASALITALRTWRNASRAPLGAALWRRGRLFRAYRGSAIRRPVLCRAAAHSQLRPRPPPASCARPCAASAQFTRPGRAQRTATSQRRDDAPATTMKGARASRAARAARARLPCTYIHVVHVCVRCVYACRQPYEHAHSCRACSNM